MSDIFKLCGYIAIKNEEANKAIDETTQKAKDLGGALDGTGTSADNASEKMGSTSKINTSAIWLGNVLYGLTTKATDLTLKLGKIGIGFNAGIESYQYQFKALLNDEDKAKQLVDDIQELAKVSPLGLEGLAGNAVTLLTTGTKLAEIIPTLEMLGNLALGDPQHMDSVVKAFTQIIGKGGLMAQEMYQLGDAMVPIVEIMTKYGGERYADGSWYQQKMTDPTFKIPAEDMIRAFHAATEEGGKWHDFMYIYMESFAGQWDRLGEQSKETLGMVTQSLFDVLKSDVLPKLTESLEKFGTWAIDNQDSLKKVSDAFGKLAVMSFDKMLEALQWLIDNREKAKSVFAGIATALYLGAISAHPYATAIATIVAGLAALTAHENKVKGGEILAQYSDEELANLQAYVEAMRELQEAQKAWDGDWGEEATNRLHAAEAAKDAAEAAVRQTDGLMNDYMSYLRMNGVGKGEDIWIDVPPRLEEGSESILQDGLDAMTLEATAQVYPDVTRLYNLPTVTAYANLIPIGSGSSTNRWINNLPGFAKGIDFVSKDNMLARLHKGEAVLTSSEAAVWRSGGVADTGRLETAIRDMSNRLEAVMQMVVNNTAAGHKVVLDTGIVAGQMAPMIDQELGKILGRKGRRN